MTSARADREPGLPGPLADIFREVASELDGATLVRARLADERGEPPTAVLAVGKVSFPMFAGYLASCGAPPKALLVAPPTRFPEAPNLAPGTSALVGDHPNPTPRSVDAGTAAERFVQTLSPKDRLLVLLSGGGSSVLCAPALPLTLEDKRAAVKAVSRAGATIAELNTVRKHLSRIKGGQLGALTKAPTQVWALSDVVGNDPATIASGPFSADPTTFAQAEALLNRWAPDAPAPVKAWIGDGVRGLSPETPKPGDGRLDHVKYECLAGPENVRDSARQVVQARGFVALPLSANVETDVEVLAATYVARAHAESASGGAPRVCVGNGEPSIVVRGQGTGGRATHLALLVAKGINGLAGVRFLAAGTDDRDGSAPAAGAEVHGGTWAEALRQGLDPQAALDDNDAATVLGALGALVHGPGTSNLLDLHLLGVGI